MSNSISRRDVLRGAGAGALAVGLSHPALAQLQAAKSDRIRFAAVGVGGKGWSNIEAAAKNGDIVALCDIDANTLANGVNKWPGSKPFADFRVMLEQMGPEIDAVLVSTPDHTHAVAAAMALRMKKAVYCEKPLTRTIWEARELAKLARRAGVATQMGNQFTAHPNLRKIAAHIKAGTWGKVLEVHCWTNRAAGWWPQGTPNRPETKPVPAHVSWDLWLGPAPERPYAEGYHPFAWRGRWDFGTGSLGDIGCHCMNMPFMGLNLRSPLAVSAEVSDTNTETYPLWSIVTYEFAETKLNKAMKLYWYDGGKLPPAALAPGIKLESNGCLLICEKGTVYSPGEYAGSSVMVGGGEIPEIDFVQSPGHMEELALAIKGGPKPVSNIPDYSGPLTETVLLGNLAILAAGQRVEWDARNMRVKNNRELAAKVEHLIRPKFRSGWKL